MKELKPCPFCGEKDDIDYGVMTGTMYGLDYVQCEKCGALIHAIHIGNEKKQSKHGTGEWKNEL